jgi:hypothetical protein
MQRGPEIVGTFISTPTGVAVSVAKGSDIEIVDSHLSAGKIAFEERDQPVPLVDAPPEELLRILRKYMTVRPATEEAAVDRLKESGAERWLKAGALPFRGSQVVHHASQRDR